MPGKTGARSKRIERISGKMRTAACARSRCMCCAVLPTTWLAPICPRSAECTGLGWAKQAEGHPRGARKCYMARLAPGAETAPKVEFNFGGQAPAATNK